MSEVRLLVRGPEVAVERLEGELRAEGVVVARQANPRLRGVSEVAEMVVAQLLVSGSVEAIRAVVAAHRRAHGSESVTTDESDDPGSSDAPDE